MRTQRSDIPAFHLMPLCGLPSLLTSLRLECLNSSGLVLSSRFFSIPYFFSVVGRNYPELATSQLEIQQES